MVFSLWGAPRSAHILRKPHGHQYQCRRSSLPWRAFALWQDEVRMQGRAVEKCSSLRQARNWKYLQAIKFQPLTSSRHVWGPRAVDIFMQLFLWECLSLCVLFLYFAEPAYELALKFGLAFSNSEIYSKDYGEGFFSAKWTVIFQTIDSCHIDFQACREMKSLLTWDCQSFGSLACDA